MQGMVIMQPARSESEIPRLKIYMLTGLQKLLRHNMSHKISQLMEIQENSELATFAGGCFWGVDYMFRKHFGDKGLIDAAVGYANGSVDHPSYKEVCGGKTGHAEALQVQFDPSKVSFETLCDFFMRIHDPTTLNAQGPDVGTQYRSAIFVHSTAQEPIAREIIERTHNKFYPNTDVVTEVETIKNFWDAETYHQHYLEKHPGGYECPTHYLRE